MKWQEVRRLYPNQYVVLEELESHIEGNKKYVEDVAIIKPIDDSKEATRELVRSKGKKFVYHTAEDTIVIEIVRSPGVRGVSRYEN
ncbi:hypothetical protein SAMN05446037_101572 [Anaerovirgula multivorans]|uniref:Uncharacterized protein n=1 Tax=Anaerovirgula multivorans TaxID=312168 RepID=A0A239G8K7_9FIRM|nr:hypothetical protein [Anaerovirgula multivorans]SNS64364.1 hypothetical protein SAMN05446037_101572 [Anaerovirgula multivorans]